MTVSSPMTPTPPARYWQSRGQAVGEVTAGKTGTTLPVFQPHPHREGFRYALLELRCLLAPLAHTIFEEAEPILFVCPLAQLLS